MSLCVREVKLSTQRKYSCGSPLVSIAEREETEEQEGLEPDGAECTTNSANGTNKKEVHRITLCWAHSVSMCVFTILQSILLFNIKL